MEINSRGLRVNYYVMECSGEPPVAALLKAPAVGGMTWMHGNRVSVKDGQLPFVYELDPQRPGHMKAMYNKSVPLMRDDLLELLLGLGVENLQRFPAVIRDAVNHKVYADYQAFNIVGRVACASRDESTLAGTTGFQSTDTDFESLVIDETKIPARMLMFRLEEAVDAIVVHRSVMEAVEKRGIKGMDFYGPGEWSG